ncbi:MAG: hypothetical protein KDK70_26195 [Myxococcales bacterium]|nr:hypothetical protein [Myxococcales bacterium]
MTRLLSASFPRLVLDHCTRPLLVALALGTTACPGDDSPSSTGDDSSTGDPTTTTMNPVTLTLTVTDTEDPTITTTGVDSTGTTTDDPTGDTTASTTDEPTTAGPTCGDDVAEGGEECDGTDLGGEDCMSQGFDDGDLGCAADCTFDTSGCTATPICGNDMIDGRDVCDGADLGGEDCASQGFDGGTLGCQADCMGYDTSMCTVATCEDENVGMSLGAVSMGDTTGADDDFTPSCGGTDGPDHVVLFTAPAAGIFIFDTFGSVYDTKLALFADCDPLSEIVCNDDTGGLQSEVQLDMMAGQTVYVVIDGFDGSTGQYVLNITAGPVCGDGAVTGTEACDGADVGGATCASAGLTGAGPITCAPDCTALDAANCNAPAGYGNCLDFPEAQVCTAMELCASDGTNSVCLGSGCATAMDCPAAPGTGNAPVVCQDVTADGSNDCYLDCTMGETCPNGMTCELGFICLRPA